MRWIADENPVSFTALFLHHSVTLASFISAGPVLKILQAAVKCSFELHTDSDSGKCRGESHFSGKSQRLAELSEPGRVRHDFILQEQ